ncbi:MAG: amidohydrolase family protein [Nitrososphaerales archaeon]
MAIKKTLTGAGRLFSGRKIDSHAHIGSFGGWANVSCAGKDVINLMAEYNVEKSCLFYTDNLLVRSAVKRYPKKLVGYVWPNPNDEASVKLVRKAISEWGFKGIKLHPLVHAFLPNSEIVYPIMDEARKSKVPVLIHSGHAPFSLPWSIGELAENYRDVTIVMLHMGHGHGVYIEAAINTAKRFDNIYLETSGMPMHTKIKEAVEILGENRVMYGSDIPFHDPAVEITKVTASGLSQKNLERVFYWNAREILAI